MKSATNIYTVRLDLTPEVISEATKWNNTAHIQDLLDAGVSSAVRYRSVQGNPEYLHLYEIPSLDTLYTDIYANVKKNDSWGPNISHGFKNHTASIYDQVVMLDTTPTPDRKIKLAADSWGSIRSNYLVTIRMDVADSHYQDFVNWNREDHLPSILGMSTAKSARLCYKTKKQHPTNPSSDPQWLSIYEITSLEFMNDPILSKLNSTASAKHYHSITTNLQINVLERIHPQ